MSNILSGFSFSHKKDLDNSTQHSENRSDSMRLTKNDPAIAFPGESGDFNVTELPTAKPSAVIGPKIRFKGELSGEEDLLVLGMVEGKIDLKGNHLTIGSEGVIKANVSARAITVEGRVEGDIIATERIAIKSTSQVKGNLKAERVTLEDGAKFRGSIDMDVETIQSTTPVYTPGQPTE
jgi:cytoskeletal protein CcmA (bactofilin family)